MATFRKYRKKNGTTTVTARIRLDGFEDTKTFTTITAAKQWAKRREVEIREKPHLANSEAHKHTVGEAITRYIDTVVPTKAAGSQTKDVQRLGWWNERYGHMTLDLFQAPVLAESRDRLSTEPTRRHGQKSEMTRSPATVVRYMAVMAHLLKTAHREWHWIQVNPAEQVSKPKESSGRAHYLSDEGASSELVRLLDACAISEAPDLYLAVLMSIATGGRRNEILGLRWKDVDLQASTVTLSGQKTKTKRAVSVPEDVAGLLRERRGIGRALVFPSPNDPKRPVDLRSAWETALRRSGIEDFHWHDLRHTAASYLAMEGASLADIAGVLGHKTLQMVARYSHLSPAHVAQASKKIGNRLNGKLGGGRGQ